MKSENHEGNFRKALGLGGENNIRWPNSFFAKYGLFNLEAACIAACQSAQR